ncbi:MAG: hypothetical protein ABSF48_29495 [Thermodesulfobacteriota bacterium]
MDATKSVDDRVAALLSQMTLAEKIGQMTQIEKNAINPANSGAYNLGSMTYDEWRGNPGKPDYAIVRNLSRIPPDPTVQVIHQNGNFASKHII